MTNIGPKGCKRRGAMAWVWLVLGVALVGVLAARRDPIAWHVFAAIPFFLAALGHFQAREQTCVFLAVVGQRNLDGGAERITDPNELSRVRSEATRIWIRAVVATVGLTALAFMVAAIVG